MTFPSGLKRICDISFYMTFASIVGALFGADRLIFTLPIFVLVAFLSAFLAPRGPIKYISLIPLFLLFVTTSLTIINVAILTPAVILMAMTLPKRDERVIQFNYDTVFYVFLIVFGFFAFYGLIMASWVNAAGLPSDTWLFAASFLLNAIMFMRMARHDESVLKQTRFKLMNATTLIGVIGATAGIVLLGTEAFLTFIWRVIGLMWSYFIEPVFRVIIWVFLVILTFIFQVFGLDAPFDAMEMWEMPELLEEEVFEWGESEASQMPRFFVVILVIIAIIVVAVLLWLLFKWLNKKNNDVFVGEDGVEEERFSLDGDEERKKRWSRRHNENQVREVYRRFLAHVKKKGIDVPQHLTSYDVEGLVATKFESERSNELRDEYVRVRYGEAEYTKDDVKRVKGLYKEFKNNVGKD